MSMIAAAQWTAVATIVLVVFSVVTAVFASLAYRKQSKEVRTLEAHMTDIVEWAPPSSVDAPGPLTTGMNSQG